MIFNLLDEHILSSIIMTGVLYQILPNNKDNLIEKGVIIAFHGGCFTGGSPDWDQNQNHLLRSLGYRVYQVNFPKSHQEFIEWAKKPTNALMYAKYHNLPLYCLGRSSGGYLAKLYSSLNSDVVKTIYICPVFNPMLRCHIKPKFAQKTLDFFGTDVPIDTNTFNENKELLLLAHQDQNVPRKCFTEEQLVHAKFLGPKTHTGMLTSTSKKFIDIVDEFLSCYQE